MSVRCGGGKTALTNQNGEREMASFSFTVERAARTRWRARRDASRAGAEPARDSLGGPGWFDSSFDLRQGLDVREGLPTEPQLHEWIEACLRA